MTKFGYFFPASHSAWCRETKTLHHQADTEHKSTDTITQNKKHLKNVGPIRHCEPFYIAIHQMSLLLHAATVARRLHINVHDNDDDNNDNDNTWQRDRYGPIELAQ